MSGGHHPYQAPGSNVVVEQVPVSFAQGKLTVARLKMGVVMSVFYAMLTVPLIIVSVLSGMDRGSAKYEIASHVLAALSFMVGTYLILLFKSFLHLRFAFHRVDLFIYLGIGLSALMLVLTLFMGQAGEESTAVQIAYFALLAAYGVVMGLFGWRLRRAPYYRGMNLFAWLNIVIGVCTASVILFLLSVLLSVVYGISMAIIFSAAADEMSLNSA